MSKPQSLVVDFPKLRAMKGHQSSAPESTIWLTPPELVRALGRFDLDPCAAPSPRPWETADASYELPDDGLMLPWQGRVWCNPPFGAKTDAWLNRAALHSSATVLLPAATETDRWFRYVWGVADAVCFLRGRPHFHYPDGRRAAANSGCAIALVAYGRFDALALRASGLGAVVDAR